MSSNKLYQIVISAGKYSEDYLDVYCENEKEAIEILNNHYEKDVQDTNSYPFLTRIEEFEGKGIVTVESHFI